MEEVRGSIPLSSTPKLQVSGLPHLLRLRTGDPAERRLADVSEPCVEVAERAAEVQHRYVGQAPPKTARKAAIGLHPAGGRGVTAASRRAALQGLYDPEGFVFCTRNGTPISVSNLQPGADGQHRLGAVHRPRRGRVGRPGNSWPACTNVIVGVVVEFTYRIDGRDVA